MKAYTIKSFNSIAGVQSTQLPDPIHGEREVVIRVMAASLNKRDILILNQSYPLAARKDVIPLSDGAGVVVKTGKLVSRFTAGDRVSANYFPRWRSGAIGMDIMDQLGCTMNGMLSEYITLHEDCLVRIPEHLTFEEAASLPCAALTAFTSLGSLSPSSVVMTIGSGGVALFAIQLAKLCGARVISVTTQHRREGQLKALGADEVIGYDREEDWHKQVLALSNGIDKVIETGGPDTLMQSIQCCSIGAEIVLLTPTASQTKIVDLNELTLSLFARNIALRSQFVGSRLSFEALNVVIGRHKLRPVIDSVFAFDQVHQAYERIASGNHFGKVIISISQ